MNKPDQNSKPAFSGERIPFASAFKEVSRGVARIKQKDYLNEGPHPIIDQGQLLVSGYSDSEEGLFTDVPAIVFGDHTRCVKYIEEPFFAGADGVKILKPALSGNDRYWYHALRSVRIENLGYSRHFKLLKETSFPAHSAPRQAEICAALDKSLDLIERRKKTISRLQSLVKSRFVEMFGDPVDNPHNWPVEKLSTLGNLKNGINFRSTESGQEIPCLGVSDFKNRSRIDDMSLISRIRIDNELGDSQVLKDGDVIFVRSNGNKQLVGRCLAIFPKSQKVTFSGFCIRFRSTSNKTNLEYLLSTLKTSSMRSAMMGRGANIQNLNQKILANLEIPIPPLELQREFAAFAERAAKLEFVAQQQIEKRQKLYNCLVQEYFG